MDGTKEWFTLREITELWRPADACGERLTGSAAIDEVLKLIFVSVAGVRLQSSYDLKVPIQAERFVWRDEGRWERFELEGVVNIRFRRDHIRSDDGFIWIHADDGCDGVPNELFVLPDDPKLKIRVACQHNMVAEDECSSDSVVKLDEAGLLVSRGTLTEYARKRGRDDVLERLDKQKTVLVVPAVEEVEPVKECKSETGHTDLLLPSRDELISKFTSQAHGLLKNGKSRKETAEELKQAGATLEMIGVILTDDGSENRTRAAWEKRAARLLKGELKGFA